MAVVEPKPAVFLRAGASSFGHFGYFKPQSAKLLPVNFFDGLLPATFPGLRLFTGGWLAVR